MNIGAGKQENKKAVRKMVNHIYQGISGLFAANKLLNTVRYRSLGRSAAALLRAAYCGVSRIALRAFKVKVWVMKLAL
ncbi:MAG: hypothetical protein KDD58_16565, partial [Bdellovibrionales bacterium]|nr:hypothetical protein [Bdellovibrionales bacterium]